MDQDAASQRRLLANLSEAAELARAALATGDTETFSAVVKLVGHLLERARQPLPAPGDTPLPFRIAWCPNSL
jgi:hypothetical protein